jgi:quercetin dioxygenase-like cupin family protein
MAALDDNPTSPLRVPTIYITTHNTAGKATIHSSNKDSLAVYPGMRTSHKLVYTSVGLPIDINNEHDIAAHQALAASGNLSIVKPNGTVCRIVDFAPHNKGMMHRTQSLDLGVVLEGSVVMELDDGSATRMEKGDVAVQRGTMHSWKNASEEGWARMLFVLQESSPLLVSGERFEEDLSRGKGLFPSSHRDVETSA